MKKITFSFCWMRGAVFGLLALACLLMGNRRPVDAQGVRPFLVTSGGQTTSYSGQATAVRATVLGVNTVISDTGPLPPSGGAQQASLLSTNAGLLTADALHATTIGQGDASEAHASVADLNLTVGGNTISTTIIRARALARCVTTTSGDPPAVSGSSEVVALTINNGQPIAVTGQPNQTISLPNGQLVINEQQSSINGQMGSITVNALHITINNSLGAVVADVVISSAHADITCPAGPILCAGDDFEVGEGEDHDSNGDDEEHSVASGSKQNEDGSYWGHFEFVRHGANPLTVHATKITKFVRVDAYTRHIEGWCEINGQGGHTFTADTTDNQTRGGSDEYHMKTDRGDEGGNKLDHGDEDNEEPCDP